MEARELEGGHAYRCAVMVRARRSGTVKPDPGRHVGSMVVLVVHGADIQDRDDSPHLLEDIRHQWSRLGQILLPAAMRGTS